MPIRVRGFPLPMARVFRISLNEGIKSQWLMLVGIALLMTVVVAYNVTDRVVLAFGIHVALCFGLFALITWWDVRRRSKRAQGMGAQWTIDDVTFAMERSDGSALRLQWNAVRRVTFLKDAVLVTFGNKGGDRINVVWLNEEFDSPDSLDQFHTLARVNGVS